MAEPRSIVARSPSRLQNERVARLRRQMEVNETTVHDSVLPSSASLHERSSVVSVLTNADSKSSERDVFNSQRPNPISRRADQSWLRTLRTNGTVPVVDYVPRGLCLHNTERNQTCHQQETSNKSYELQILIMSRLMHSSHAEWHNKLIHV